MTTQGEIVNLQPGTATDWTQRADVSPIAQRPDSNDVIAHTPDPTKYHEVNGRTMIPRAKMGKKNHASQGFTTTPGILNIDPADPVTGAGGITVDLSNMDKKALHQGSEAGDGDPYRSWLAAVQIKQGAAAPPQQVAPVQSQVMDPNSAEAMMTPSGPPVASPAVQPTQGSSMPIPQPVAQAPTAMPQPVQQPAMTAVPQPVQPQPTTAVPQQVQQPQIQYVQTPQPVQPQYTAAPPTLAPAPAPVQGPDNVQTLQVMQGLAATMKVMQETLQEMRHKPDPEIVVKDEGSQMQMSSKARDDIEAPTEEVETMIAVPEETGLEHFLTTPPSPPKVQVVFDLGKGGQHLKRFHYLASSGKCLTMVYDTRYEGDQFIPPATEADDPPIEIRFPQHRNKTVKGLVPKDFNQRLGCLDLLNFIIVDDDPEVANNFAELTESLQQ